MLEKLSHWKLKLRLSKQLATIISGMDFSNNDSNSNWKTRFQMWLQDRNIKMDKNISIEPSEKGGMGLFYTGSIDDTNDDLIVATIPKKSCYDYKQFLHILKELEKKERRLNHRESCPKHRDGDIIKSVLKALTPETETEVCIGYIVGFYLCNVLRKESGMEDQAKIEPYLEILCSTYVVGPPKGDYYKDEFTESLARYFLHQRHKYECLKEGTLLEPSAFTRIVSYEKYCQLAGAVRSRALEIPFGDDASQDYYTNVTLVPLLDFANHADSLYCNSHFDVDRELLDVVLKVKKNKIASNKERRELLISYCPTEDIRQLSRTYGFVPTLSSAVEHYQLLELKFSGASVDKHINKIKGTHGVPYRLIMKWLHILPQVLLVHCGQRTYINFFSNNLPVIFVPNLQYNRNWPDLVYEDLKGQNIASSRKEYDDEILLVFLEQERNCDYILGVGQKGVICNSLFPKRESFLENTGYDSDKHFDNLISDCKKFILLVAQEIVQNPPTCSSSDSFALITKQYYSAKASICRSLLQNDADGLDIALPIALANDLWETDHISPPVVML